jgi:hypothetical protein
MYATIYPSDEELKDTVLSLQSAQENESLLFALGNRIHCQKLLPVKG